MTIPHGNRAVLVNELALRPGEGDLFVGKLRGFPFGLKFIESPGSVLLLFQIRHPFLAQMKEVGSIQFCDEIVRLMEQKKITIEFEDKLIWLTFVDAENYLESGMVKRLLDEILSSLETAGLAPLPDICFYCGRNKVESLTCIDGKVAQICPICLQERLSSSGNRPGDSTEGVASISVLTPVAATIGAVCWTLVWIGYDLLFELLKTNVIYVPRIVELVVLVCVAAIVGGPIGFLIKRVRRRGGKLSVVAAVVCTIGAIMIGETLYVAWLIYREFKVFSLSAAWSVLPRLELEMGGFHLVIKALAAFVSIVLAAEIAKPSRGKLNL
ncbi:MAG TPA: hypothetical protein VN887_02210 [Candidatus Angelobacter sp.]|nr:hypothetical protein [Candidatus Angelobacter sp.]